MPPVSETMIVPYIMLAVLFLTIYATLITYALLPKIGLNIRSNYLRISLSWFTGIYLAAFLIFLLALFFSIFSNQVLTKASFTVLFALELFGTVLLIKTVKDMHMSIKKMFLNRNLFTGFNIIVVGACFLFSFLFFSPQLAMKNSTIYTSPIYWDFHWHAAVIQNFVYGDNFPPQDESFAGVPMTYHFFGDLVFSIYESLGVNLVTAINYGSIIAFSFSLLAIIGISEELFNTKIAGIIASLLAISSGSGHFYYYFLTMQGQSIFEIIGNILGNNQHPWYASFIPGSPYNYTGTFFNLFYFLEERHMIFGIPYLLFCIFIIYKRQEFSKKILLVAGIIMGLFFYWEVYITIMVLCALLFVLIFDSKRKQTLYLLLGFLASFLCSYAYLKQIIDNALWFIPTQIQYPKIDFGFIVDGGPPIHSISDYITAFVRNYEFAYGLRGLFFFISLFLIWKKDKKLSLTLMAFVIPTFILLNTVKLSPSVSENHKWIVPMNIIVDIIAAMAVSKIFFEKRNFLVKSIGVICLFLLTISGTIELMPFLNSMPNIYYSQYNSPIIKAIQTNSSPHAVFFGPDEPEIHLAGRKLFVGYSAGPDYALNKEPRKDVLYNIYSAPSVHNFCQLTKISKIDFLEVDKNTQTTLFNTVKILPFFSPDDESPTVFINAQDGCKKY